VLGGDLQRCVEGGYYLGVDFIEGFMILRGQTIMRDIYYAVEKIVFRCLLYGE